MRALLISYHHGSASEVGALRTTALAEHLGKLGAQVDVICEGLPTREHSGASPRLLAVPDRPSRLLSLLVGLKRRVLLEEPSKGRSSGDSGAGSLPTALPHGIAAWTRRQTLSLLYCFGRHKRWSLSALCVGLREARRARYDWVISSGPPTTPHIAAVIFGKLTRTPVAIDLRDPWAGNPASWMESARWSMWLDGLAERACLSAAQIVTCATPGIERRLVARSDALRRKTHVIFNGFDEQDRISGAPPSGALRMLYAGSLYVDRNPFPVLECLAELIRSGRVDRARVTFDFIGEADSWRGRSIEDWAAANSLHDVVRYGGRVSRSQVRSLITSANVLVNFVQGHENTIPAKTFQYLASGRAMLVVTEPESDIARVLAGVEAAICVDDRDRPGVERTLLGLYHRFTIEPTDHSRVAHDVERFSRLRQNEAWAALLEYDSPVVRAEIA